MRKGCIFFAFVAFLNPSVAFIRCSSSFSRPLRVAYLSFFDEVFSESFATATPDVSTAELSSILPLAALGATLAVSKTAYKQRDGLRKNLNATEATLISKRKQVIAAGKKANTLLATSAFTTVFLVVNLMGFTPVTRSYMAGDQVKVIESVERVGSVGMVKNGDVSRKPIDTSGQNSNKPAISLTEYDTVYSGLFSNVESSKSVYAETSSEGSINSEGKSKLFSDDLRSRAQTRYDAFLERSELVELLKTFSRDELFELPTEVKFFVLGALLSAVVVASLTEAQKFAEAANVKYEDDRTLPTSAEKPPFFASVKVATVKKPTFRLSQTIPSAPSPKLVHSNITATGSVVESKSILFLSEYVKEELPTIPVGADTTLKPSSMKAVLKNAGQNMLADKISLKRKLFEVEEKEFMPSSTFSVNGVENYVEAIARVVSGTVGRIETTSKIACNVNERLIRNSKLVVDKFLAVNGDKIIALIFPREPSQDSRLARARTASVEGSVESTGKTSVGDCKFLSTYHEQCPPGQLLNGEYPGESFPTLTANTDETDSLLTANEAPSKSLSPTGPYLEMLSGNYGSNRR